jgi:hypothetical protein
MSYCIQTEDYIPGKHKILSGPWASCNDCSFGSSSTEGFSGSSSTEGFSGSSSTEGLFGSSTTEGFSGSSTTEGFSGSSTTEGFSGSSSTEPASTEKPCRVCGSSSSEVLLRGQQPNSLPCCPQGPTGNGDIHFLWNGYDINGDIHSGVVVFDDNYLKGSLADGEQQKVDHYAVEWVEVHKDGSVHAFLSERKITCMWTKGSIATNVYTIGNPTAAKLSIDGAPGVNSPECTGCKVKETMFQVHVDIDYDKLEEISAYGGLHWEAMKYISKQEITQNGFTGPVGDLKTFSTQFRVSSSDPATWEIVSSGTMDTGYPYEVMQKITKKAQDIKRWKDEGSLDITAETEKRNSQWIRPRALRPGEPKCCSVSDIDYMNGTCPECDRPCLYCEYTSSWGCDQTSIDACKSQGGVWSGNPNTGSCGCILYSILGDEGCGQISANHSGYCCGGNCQPQPCGH